MSVRVCPGLRMINERIDPLIVRGGARPGLPGLWLALREASSKQFLPLFGPRLR